MNHGLVDDLPVPEVLHDNPLEQPRRHGTVPHSFRVDDDDRATAADAEAWRLAAFHAAGAEEQPFTLEKCREKRVQRSTCAIGRAESAGTHEHVT